MPTLNEVPGALERPSGCRIEVFQSDDGRRTTITIPPREWQPILVVGALVLLGNLLVVLYTGAALLFAHRSVLLMTQIAPGGLSPPLRRYELWLALAWLFIEGAGVLMLWLIARPMFLRERLSFDSDGVHHERRVLRRTDRWFVSEADVRSFLLQRDPQGLSAGVLTLHGRGEERMVGENISEAEREWLASVGNALLRQSP